MARFRRIEHTADEGIAWEASTLEALFAEGAAAFGEVVAGARPEGAAGREVTLDVDGLDLPDLLVRFLSELLFLFETRSLVPLSARIEEIRAPGLQGAARLRGTAEGWTFDPARDTASLVVKAVTYHGLSVRQSPDGVWRAQVLFDV